MSSSENASANEPGAAVERVSERLHETRAALARLTGGAAPRVVLAELAQRMAAELAEHFDELPSHAFVGRVARESALGVLLPRRRVRHRVLLGRYLSSQVMQNVNVRDDDPRLLARIGLAAIGEDGVLRAGEQLTVVRLAKGTVTTDDALAWDDPRLRRVPTGSVKLARWDASTAGAARVAGPADVLDALARVAALVDERARRDLRLLERLLGPGAAGA